MPPIKPSEVVEKKIEIIPEAVFDVFNELIASAWNGHWAKVDQGEAVVAIAARLVCPNAYVFDHGYLNIETAYEAAGWSVEYDRPGFNESYPATFTFRAKRAFR